MFDMKRLSRGIRAEEGFTLLEMMIVIAIIGVFAVIAVPKFEGAMARANTAKIQMDLRTIDTAAVMYHAQTGGDADSLDKLDQYIEDPQNLKPPSGKCYIDGKLVDVPAGAYSVSSGKAMLGSYDSHSFSRDTEAGA